MVLELLSEIMLFYGITFHCLNSWYALVFPSMLEFKGCYGVLMLMTSSGTAFSSVGIPYLVVSYGIAVTI